MKAKEAAEPKERVYFPFFYSFVDALDSLGDEKTELELYRAISHYGTFGTEPELKGVAKAIWGLMKPALQSSRKQYENAIQGGAPKGNKNACKVKHTPPQSVDEVREYCEANGFEIDCDRFFDYWDGKKWEWRNPTVRTWQDAVKKWAEKETK